MGNTEDFHKNEDIFDRIMHLPVLKIFEPFYKKNKETLLYLFFGFGSFLISVLTYNIFSEILNWGTLISNFLAWCLSVAFAYITNHIWVFNNSCENNSIGKEIMKFISGRIGSLFIEEGLLWLFIDCLNYPNMAVKIFVSFIVIVINYFVSKFWVFK